MSEKHVHPPELARKVAEALPSDFLRQVLLNALAQVTEVEVAAPCAAPYGACTEERQNGQNGYRERDVETRLGTLPVWLPRVRQGSYLRSRPS